MESPSHYLVGGVDKGICFKETCNAFLRHKCSRCVRCRSPLGTKLVPCWDGGNAHGTREGGGVNGQGSLWCHRKPSHSDCLSRCLLFSTETDRRTNVMFSFPTFWIFAMTQNVRWTWNLLGAPTHLLASFWIRDIYNNTYQKFSTYSYKI